MAAPMGNQNARTQGRGRIAANLSLSEERLEWVIRQLQAQQQEPTEENIKRFIRDYCYDMIDAAQDVAAYHGYSPDELLQSVISGETATVLLPDEQRWMAIKWLKEQAAHIADPSLSEALVSIAKQLDAAVQREAESEQDDET